MYSDTITVANKIISDDDLADIFSAMDEDIRNNYKLCEQEAIANEKYESAYQNWTCKNFDGRFKCTFNFYDDTNIQVDNYNSFIGIFNSRIKEIKDMWVRISYSYTVQMGRNTNYISQGISMNIYENKMKIDVNLSSSDDKLNRIYELIKNKVLNAPEKFDRTMKKRTFIKGKVSFIQGIIPSLVICSLLAIVPTVREYYAKYLIIFPVGVLFLAFLIGYTFLGGKLTRLYSPLLPKQKYAGWDSSTQKSVYKDDMDDYLSTSEIIIGKNYNNLRNRKEIKQIEEKYTSRLKYLLLAVLIISVIMIIIGKIF